MSWKGYQWLLRSCLARSVAAWLGQGSTKQTFTFAYYAFAELSRIFRQKCRVLGGFLGAKRNNQWQQQQQEE